MTPIKESARLARHTDYTNTACARTAEPSATAPHATAPGRASVRGTMWLMDGTGTRIGRSVSSLSVRSWALLAFLLVCVGTPVLAQETPDFRLPASLSRTEYTGGSAGWGIDKEFGVLKWDPLEHLETAAANTPVAGMRGINENPLFALNQCHYGLARAKGAPLKMVDLTHHFCIEGLRAAFACENMASLTNRCGSLRQKHDILIRAVSLPLSDAERAELKTMAASIEAPVREMLWEDLWSAITKLTGCDLLEALRDFVKSVPPVSEEQITDFAQMFKPLPVRDQAFLRKAMSSRPSTPADAPAPIKAAYSLKVLQHLMATYRPAGDPSSWKQDDVATVETNLLCLGNEGDAPDQLAQFRKTWEIEQACRADQKCVNRRIDAANTKLFKKKAEEVGEDICNLRATIAETKHQIAEEHRYAKRTGVLSLGDLQELKEDLRNLEETLAERMSDYRLLLGKSAKVSCR